MSDPAQTSAPHNPTDELKALLHEAEQALASTTGEAGEKFDELRKRLRSALNSGRYSLEQLRQDAVRRAQQADRLVRENPYYAVGLAAGVGAVIGLLVSRCSHSSR